MPYNHQFCAQSGDKMGLKSLKSLQNQIRSIEFKFVKTTFMAPPL
ncbi:hypothetical protein HAL013_02750 [Helicobacter ailurogastricus]|uniref:Uncharacterized protein n=1 Tax=Helicobacter ailurogastricus TaxID=1578720 RepID=A0A0K2XBX5_9HELI|nr:hypothetical protein HAL011_06620 [Helicobacter ailurogastricus]CRF42118.1 hypothetical protein HAL013_02750 [Helicobacter ailurogastricus]CRF44032.1 hypothetical protein HAL09_06000 [Helicobacter ailurogastricus]